MAAGMIRRSVLPLAFGGLLAWSPPAAAESVHGWNISTLRDGDGCVMSSVYEDNVMFSIFWYPRTEETMIAFGSNEWDSLRERDKQDVKVDLQFGGKVEYDHWWDDHGHILALDDGFEAVSANFDRKDQLDLAVSLSYATNVSVEIDGKVIGKYKLDGSKDAILALRRCGGRLLKKGGDPFAD